MRIEHMRLHNVAVAFGASMACTEAEAGRKPCSLTATFSTAGTPMKNVVAMSQKISMARWRPTPSDLRRFSTGSPEMQGTEEGM